MTPSRWCWARRAAWPVLLLSLAACTTPMVDGLQPMAVKRDFKALPKPGVSFGAYTVQGLRYEPEVTLGDKVVIRQQGGQFELHLGGKAQAKVHLLGRTQYSINDPLHWLDDVPAAGSRRLKVFRSVFRQVSEPEWFFRAEVFPTDGSGPWKMVWRPAVESDPSEQLLGMITGPQGELWPLKKRRGQFEVADTDRVVASLSPPPQQEVWLADGLPATQQHVLAAWASALMLPPLH
ncbi:hypothetical protein [Ideonella sp.]|uniref:hypothetical protein n=1 Tax=Ideonella sp. TaxID=1929293 RepID=UPI0037C065DC